MASKSDDDLITLDDVRRSLTGLSLVVRFWVPTKAFTADEVDSAAAALLAMPEVISGRKRVIDTKNPAWKSLCSKRAEVRKWWEGWTLPYTVPGLRLCRKDNMERVRAEAQKHQKELAERAALLEKSRGQVIAAAREQLGGLFDEDAYPADFRKVFGMELREMDIAPPSYLAHTNAEEYKRQMMACLNDIGSGLTRFENQVWAELANASKSVYAALTRGERISPATLGQFDRIAQQVTRKSVAGSEALAACLAEAKGIVAGTDAAELRRKGGLRADTARKIEGMVQRFDRLTAEVKRLAEIDEAKKRSDGAAAEGDPVGDGGAELGGDGPAVA